MVAWSSREVMSTIFLFIKTLYLKQQTNILRCFSSLKFENSLFGNKIFQVYISQWDEGLHRWKRRNSWSIMNSKLACWKHISLCANYFLTLLVLPEIISFSKFVESFKGLFDHSGNCIFWFVLDYERSPHQIEDIL